MSKKGAILIGVLCMTVGVIGLIVQIFGEQGHAPDTAHTESAGSDLVQWQTPESFSQLASAPTKPVLYDFSAVWCGPCKRLAADVFGDAEAAAFINNNFTPVQVMEPNGEAPRSVKQLQDKFGVTGFPTLIVADKSNGQLKSIVGYGGKEATLDFLKQSLAEVTK